LQQHYSRADFPICGIISNLDGVAYRPIHPIRASVQAFQAWYERGVPYAFVTNNSTKTAAQFAAKLNGMGIPATAAQVFNAHFGGAPVAATALAAGNVSVRGRRATFARGAGAIAPRNCCLTCTRLIRGRFRLR
jgi:ribonucleotide monophosphatase NagD (HAD superfamily)